MLINELLEIAGVEELLEMVSTEELLLVASKEELPSALDSSALLDNSVVSLLGSVADKGMELLDNSTSEDAP